jgi:hypothetical protein
MANSQFVVIPLTDELEFQWTGERSGGIVSYKSLADLETVIQMGMKEGLTATLEQLDNLLLKLKK